MTSAESGRTRTTSRRRRVAFALVPLVALLFVAEVVIRLVRAPLHFGSFREFRVDLMARNYPAVRDALLGYAPKPGYASRDNHWGTVVSIDTDGFRRNGDRPSPTGTDVVAAVGDSFTFGDQVDDDATWPAWLERITERPVRNGGVFGYSLTQAVLRAEAMLERFRVATLIVSFIPDDLTRCEYEKRYTPVPWFEIAGDELVLRNVPVPTTEPDDGARRFKNALGYSALLDAVLANTCRRWWYENEKQVPVPHLVGKGGEIGKKLISRIAAKCRAHGTTLLVLLQGEKADDASRDVLRHAESLGVRTLDLATEYASLRAKGPGAHDTWFAGHMTSAGNRWVAERVAAILALPR